MHMPANRKLKHHLKSHVGRTFTLRRHNIIPTYKDSNISSSGQLLTLDEIGQAVLILDESNTRVCIVKSSGGTTWIPKYYLLRELKSETFHKYDSLSEAINGLAVIIKQLREQNNEIVNDLETIINDLRLLADHEYNNKIGTNDKNKHL
jgi:hypothetical protein